MELLRQMGMNIIKIDDLLNSIDGEFKLLGKRDRLVSNVSSIGEANSESVTFCNKKAFDGLQMVRRSKAGVVICCDDLRLTSDDFKDKTLILVSNPRLAFARVMRRHFVETAKYEISPQAVIDGGAIIHPPVSIVIGRNVQIHAGVVIGSEGQGFERNEKGELETFPQVGRVIIEDDVMIGANTSIARGAIGDTIIRQGTKIGNLCWISHKVFIGKHCLIIAHSMIGGSTRIGDYSQVSLGACIRNGVEIGKNVMVGMGAVVTKNVADNKIVFGVPAKEKGET
jgi:UDP-3-O-[3-hydroxymyristoyl] glucosamine N-acyltransferase